MPRLRADSTCLQLLTLGNQVPLARLDVHTVRNELRGDPLLGETLAVAFGNAKDGGGLARGRQFAIADFCAQPWAAHDEIRKSVMHGKQRFSVRFSATRQHRLFPERIFEQDDRRPGNRSPDLARKTSLEVCVEVVPPLPSFARSDASGEKMMKRAVENRKRHSQPDAFDG